MVAFYSYASNLVANDTNSTSDVFVHDRATGATTRVSIDSSGVEGNGGSANASVSLASAKTANIIAVSTTAWWLQAGA